MMKRFRATAGCVLVVGLVVSGCATRMGSSGIRPDTENYNEAIARSADEQLLLNLVRLRYRDRPLFLELQSVVSQRSLRGDVSGGMKIGVGGGSGNEGVLGVSGTYEEKPTVTYTPLKGEDFARRILTPLTPETIILLSNSGWSIERLFLICVSRLNGVENAPTASGPTPVEAPDFEEFRELVVTLREMQREGLLTLQVFRTPGQEMPQIEVIIDVPTEAEAKLNDRLERLRSRLNLAEGEHRLRLTSALRPTQENEIALNPRSLMGVFYYLSQAVVPPLEHEEKGLVTVTRDENGDRFDWARVTGQVFAVKSQESKPEDAFVAVRHRGYWFYIADNDLKSKTTFVLLHFLLSLQSGGDAGMAPVLTLPAG
ncbi:MAG: hypothetical protein RI897_3962 [Verrucomicrobiota bacterium]